MRGTNIIFMSLPLIFYETLRKFFLFYLLFFFSCHREPTICVAGLDWKEEELRVAYYSDLVAAEEEKRGESKRIPYGDYFFLSLHYALRDKEDSALYFFYESIKYYDFITKIYVARHIKSLTLEEKLKYINEGIAIAKKRKNFGIVFDGYLMENLVLAENKLFKPEVVDSMLKYSRTNYDLRRLEEFMLDILSPEYPEYYGKYLEITKKIKKREFFGRKY